MKNKLMKLLLLGMTGMFLAACSGDKNDTQKEESTQVEESVSAEEGTEEIPTIYFG